MNKELLQSIADQVNERLEITDENNKAFVFENDQCIEFHKINVYLGLNGCFEICFEGRFIFCYIPTEDFSVPTQIVNLLVAHGNVYI